MTNACKSYSGFSGIGKASFDEPLSSKNEQFSLGLKELVYSASLYRSSSSTLAPESLHFAVFQTGSFLTLTPGSALMVVELYFPS